MYGLLCDLEVRPILVEAFQGNTADQKSTVTQIIAQVWMRFGITNVVSAGDRAMITTKPINEDFRRKKGSKGSQCFARIQSLMDAGKISRSYFDEKDPAEITDEENFPGERLIACRNPLRADECAPRREELLEATQKDLDKIVARTQRKRKAL